MSGVGPFQLENSTMTKNTENRWNKIDKKIESLVLYKILIKTKGVVKIVLKYGCNILFLM